MVGSGGGGGGGGWHKASVSDCLPLAAPIGLSPLLILTLCGSGRVLVVSPEPPDDLSCLTTPGVGRRVLLSHPRGGGVNSGTHPPRILAYPQTDKCPTPPPGGGGSDTHPPTHPPTYPTETCNTEDQVFHRGEQPSCQSNCHHHCSTQTLQQKKERSGTGSIDPRAPTKSHPTPGGGGGWTPTHPEILPDPPTPPPPG